MLFKYEKPLFRREISLHSEPGTKEIPDYVIDFPDSGGVRLKQIGTKSIYEKIQANKSNCDLSNVIESCVHSNQYAVCTQDTLNSIITDYVGLTNLGEIFAASKRIEHTWKDLPLEVREEFRSDMKSFIKQMGSEEFDKKITSGYEKFYGSISKNINTDILLPDSGSSGSDVVNKEASMKDDVKEE